MEIKELITYYLNPESNLLEVSFRTIEDNDVADACGIGHWAMNNWIKAIGVDK